MDSGSLWQFIDHSFFVVEQIKLIFSEERLVDLLCALLPVESILLSLVFSVQLTGQNTLFLRTRCVVSSTNLRHDFIILPQSYCYSSFQLCRQ